MMRSLYSGVAGLRTHQTKMDVLGNNIANVNTTRTQDGGPFRRKLAIFEARHAYGQRAYMDRIYPQEPGRGVRVNAILDDMTPFKLEYDPNHPDADADGYVRRPNIDIVHEMVDMITATRAYEANVTCINSAKDITNAALNISSK